MYAQTITTTKRYSTEDTYKIITSSLLLGGGGGG